MTVCFSGFLAMAKIILLTMSACLLFVTLTANTLRNNDEIGQNASVISNGRPKRYSPFSDRSCENTCEKSPSACSGCCQEIAARNDMIVAGARCRDRVCECLVPPQRRSKRDYVSTVTCAVVNNCGWACPYGGYCHTGYSPDRCICYGG